MRRQARHHAHQVLAFAGLTEELQNRLKQTQKTAVDELAEIVAQGWLESHSWSNLAWEVQQRELDIRLRDEIVSSEFGLQMQVTDLTLEVKLESRIALEHQTHSEKLGKDLFDAREENRITRTECNTHEQYHDFHRLSTQLQIRTHQQTLTTAEEALHHAALETVTFGRSLR